MAAMMTAEVRRLAVDDESRAAPGTARLPAARRAQERQRESAAVDEHERLLAAREPCRERRLERRADAFERRGVPARNDHHVGLAGRRDRTLRQLLPAITSALRMDERLERRRRGAEHHRHAPLPRAPDRDVAAMVANAVLLLERRIVLLVDDDEPEPRQGREDREPRAEDEIGRAARRLAPVAQALARREPAVQRHGSLVRQRSGEALPELRSEVDLRHEDQHLPAGGHALGGGGEVHLGLAAAGDALEQEGRERSCGGDDGRCGVLLIGIERLASRRFGNDGVVRRWQSCAPPGLAASPRPAGAASAQGRGPAVPGNTWRRNRRLRECRRAAAAHPAEARRSAAASRAARRIPMPRRRRRP